MNASASVLVSVLAAAVAAVGISFAMRPADAGGDALHAAQLQSSIDALEQAQERLSKRLDELSRGPAVAAGAPARIERAEAPVVAPEQVAAAVEAYLAGRGAGPADAAAGGAGFDVGKDLKSLLGTSYWENTEAWKRAFEAGEMEEVLEQFEALAAAAPNDVQAQMDLANAYMAWLQMDNSKWQLSMKADEQFDKVLAIDGQHWEARFTKAMSYTFWPDFLGKKKDAIQHFETLIAQQETQPVADHHAQTYLFLGNLLQERDPERAREIWQQGARRHPTNADLRDKLRN